MSFTEAIEVGISVKISKLLYTHRMENNTNISVVYTRILFILSSDDSTFRTSDAVTYKYPTIALSQTNRHIRLNKVT